MDDRGHHLPHDFGTLGYLAKRYLLLVGNDQGS